ncbi:MAG: TonB system transport protein ExbD [Helicobacteraceae bacterium]|nr:TonB system transport protein ExbD [Helicobacteraceae bacterium]
MKLPRKDGLNIIPFIDIMLVLLAIVLSTATFISQGQIKINIPKSSSASKIDNEKKVQILLDSANKYYFENKETSLETLKNEINKIDSDTLIELSSDSEATFQAFVEVLDILKEKNHEKFQIQAKIKN